MPPSGETPKPPQPPPIEKRVLLLQPHEFDHHLLWRRQRLSELQKPGSKPKTPTERTTLEHEIQVLTGRAGQLKYDMQAPDVETVTKRIGVLEKELSTLQPQQTHEQKGIELRISILRKRMIELERKDRAKAVVKQIERGAQIKPAHPPGREMVKKLETKVDVIGTHGILITERLRKGVEVTHADGRMIPLRRGSVQEMIVSEKSGISWSNDFARLLTYAPSIPSTLPESDRRRLELASSNRRKLLQLIGASYIVDDNVLRTFISKEQFRLDKITVVDARHALTALRSLFERKIGKAYALESKMSTRDMSVLGLLFQHIDPKDQIVRKHILSTLPSSSAAPEKELDGIYLGLLIRDLDENANAQKEHKLSELVSLLSTS